MQLAFDFPSRTTERESPLLPCPTCGLDLPKRSGSRGAPPKYHVECRPPRSFYDKRIRRQTIRACAGCDRIILNPRKFQRQCSTCTRFYAMVAKGRSFARYVRRTGRTKASPYHDKYCTTCFRLLGRSGSPYGSASHNCNHCNPPAPPAEPPSSEVRAWPRIIVRNCAWCDTHYHADHFFKFCSDQCRKESAASSTRRSHIAKQRDPRTHTCETCTTPIPTSRNKCDECNAETRRIRKRSEKRRIRARKYGVKPGRYTLHLIAQRDEFTCGLCHKPVDMNLIAPDFGAATVDHIVPLCAGGSDDPSNVQLAHFICNSRAGTKGHTGGGGAREGK